MYTTNTTITNPAQAIIKVDGKIINISNVTYIEPFGSGDLPAADSSVRIYFDNRHNIIVKGFNVETFWDFLNGGK